MSEKLPVFANLQFEDREVEATRANTSVYNHYGKGELYDHVFVQIDEKTGTYIWAQIPPDNPIFPQLAGTAIEHGCETHLNIQKVSKVDLRAFGKAATRDLDERPDWLD